MASATSSDTAYLPPYAPAAAAPGIRTRLRPWAALRLAITESRRRKSVHQLKRHQAFTPLIGVKYVGLTLEELLIPMTWHD